MKSRTLFGAEAICVALVLFCINAVAGAKTVATKGKWKGFVPGEFALVKRTVHNSKHNPNGVSYAKSILWKINDDGTGSSVTLSANRLEGPWKADFAWDDGKEPGFASGAVVSTNASAREVLTISGKTFPCDFSEVIVRDDWGTTTYKRWKDRATGIELKMEEDFAGQNYEGKPSKWHAIETTLRLEKVTVDTNEFECFVQEQTITRDPGISSHWNQWISDSAPGRVVRMKSWSDDKSEPEMEHELIEIGFKPELIDDYWRDSHRQGMSTDEDDAKRRRDEEAAEARKVHESLERMIAKLSSDTVRDREGAASALASWDFGDADKQAVIDALRRALDDKSPHVRRDAAWGLSRLGVKALTPRFIAMMRDDPKGTSQYLRALGKQGDDEALKIVLEYSTNTNRALCSAAAMALGNFHSDSAREALEKLATDKKVGAQYAALQSLETVGDARSASAVINVLQQTNKHLIPIAVRLVAKWNSVEAVPALLNILKKGDDLSRFTVATFLAQMKLRDDEAVRLALLDALDDPDLKVRSAAGTALGQVRERRAVPKLIQMANSTERDRGWLDPRIAAAMALAKIGDDDAVAALQKLLPDNELRVNICNALTGPNEAMAKMLWDDYQKATDRMTFNGVELEALARIGTPATAAELKEYLPKCPPQYKRSIRETIAAIEKRSTR